jgi:DNA end-binding protein Ku
MPRPIWKGYITFGLVNIPVVLFSAEKKSEIQFKLLDSRTKARVRYKRVNEDTGKEVPWEEVVKGYEYNEGNYVLLPESELKSIAGENSKTIDIDNFIDAKSLDIMLFEKPYYLVPDKKGDKGYVILREVLTSTKKVAIAKVIIHTRQYLCVLMPHEDALVLNVMRYFQEIRPASEFDIPSADIKKYKITSKELDIAKQLVDSMTAKWKPESYEDEYRKALEEFIEEKIHHAKPHSKMKKRASSGKSSNVIDFVSLLKKSIKQKKTTKSSKKTVKQSHKKVRKG